MKPDIIRDAIGQAVEQMMDSAHSLSPAGTLSTEEQVKRYERHHRGRPLALLQFVRKSAPRGVNVLEEAARYEAAMENLRRQR